LMCAIAGAGIAEIPFELKGDSAPVGQGLQQHALRPMDAP